MAAPVRGNLLLGGLDERTRGVLAPHLERFPFAQGVTFFSDGEELRHVQFVDSGLISLVTTLSDGFTVETSAVGREGAVGVTADLRPTPSSSNAVGQIAGQVFRIELARLREIAQADEDLRHKLSLLYEHQVADSRQSAACLARHSVVERTCRWLVRCHDRIGGDELRLTHELLAHMLGTRRSTVSTVAADLEKAGLIRYSRGAITVLDRRGLEARACECYATMRRRSVDLGLEPPQAPF